jgi:hypothetical protein
MVALCISLEVRILAGVWESHLSKGDSGSILLLARHGQPMFRIALNIESIYVLGLWWYYL